MHGTMDRFAVAIRQRRRPHASSKVTVRCEVLEERSLLTAFGAPGAIGLRGSRAAEMSFFGAGRQNGMFGRGSLGLGGGMMNPTLLMTAPLLDSAGGTATPPSPSTMSSTAVQTALQTLQTDLNNDIPTGAQPTHASVGRARRYPGRSPQGDVERDCGADADPVRPGGHPVEHGADPGANHPDSI